MHCLLLKSQFSQLLAHNMHCFDTYSYTHAMIAKPLAQQADRKVTDRVARPV